MVVPSFWLPQFAAAQQYRCIAPRNNVTEQLLLPLQVVERHGESISLASAARRSTAKPPHCTTKQCH
jgi:hypothetical protein